MLVDGGVFEAPVVGEAEAGPQMAKGLFVFLGGDVAEFDEVFAADGFEILFLARALGIAP